MRDSLSLALPGEQFEDFMLAHSAQLIQARFDHPPLAFVHSFGCQQNVSDTEHIKGLLVKIGFGFTDNADNADFVLFNTCAVRETAEDRVFGNVGALKNIKRARPDMIIALCGCMMQQQSVADKIKNSFPYVDIVFGTGALHRLPAMIADRLAKNKRVFDRESAKTVVEGVPIVREGGIKSWLPIMQGCDNFCSYCIVPHVRGREVSREPARVEAEAREILAQGFKEITLLGQNVNSYGKGLNPPYDFTALLKRLDKIPGEYRIRFMTSHPKDCTFALIDAIAESTHICHHIHLPVQSGNDRVLKAMNRHYDIAHYRALITYAKQRIEGVTFSSDIIVGFPGETRTEFLDTLNLVKEVGYNALFTFIYSRRSGTSAANMPDIVSEKEKSQWFRELLKVQQDICSEHNHAMVGKTLRVLIDSVGKSGEGCVAGRTEGNVIVEAKGDHSLIGSFANVQITEAMNWAMIGTIVQ
ncbi:MAG: tRNA (N6-isopentenyl adenosine(37)-C2)-methylthiotransferase MiaB [Candidatus Fimivivens sp.]